MPTIVERYTQKFRGSAELAEQGRDAVPGGAHLTRPISPHPVFVDEARGPLKWDADGNELVDYMMGYGALLLGNAHPTITKAVAERLGQGTHMGTPSQMELEWARLVQELIPGAELVRFTGSGTESTLLGLRLARGYTGKSKPESTEGGRRVSILKWPEGALLNLG